MFNKTNTGSSTPETTKKPTPSSPRSVPSSSVAAPSILASDIIITGDIKTNGDVQIDGRLDGNIKANNVTIGEEGNSQEKWMPPLSNFQKQQMFKPTLFRISL